MLKRTWSIAAVVAGLLPAMALGDALAADSPIINTAARSTSLNASTPVVMVSGFRRNDTAS